jgi:ABC-type branched-subunit amino acid transport system permease subunit
MGFKFLSRSSMRGEKATLGTSLGASLTPTTIARLILRFFQFVMGLTVIGLYAVDLDNARKQGKYVDSKWVWAVVCGTLGAITSLAFMLPLFKSWFFFGVDALIFLCYLVAFGIFGNMFISENPEGNKGIIRMKNAVWVLLTNMLLWLITAVIGAVMFWRTRKARTTHTGRAGMHV